MSTPPLHADACPHELARILAVARARSGVDFRAYRRSTLERRIQSRMASVSAPTYGAYLRRLERDPAEAGLLCDWLTIKVSRFFRNARTYRRLDAVLREQRAALAPGERLRIWSAGCGRGEEPYSLAMLLCGLPGPAPAGAICATDVDPGALDVARRACFPPEALEELDADLRSRHLAASSDPRRPYRVAEPVASLVTFLPHDLTASDRPPWSGGFHLVCCRNVLIYLTPAAQRRVFDLLLGSLVPGGHLCLGRAEMPPPSLLARLGTVDDAAHVFRARAPSQQGIEA